MRTSKVCHHSPTADVSTAAGVATKPAARMRTSHGPTCAATAFMAVSSVTLTAWREQLAVLGGSALFVSARVASLRPRRTSLPAPARAKVMAVSRPIPLPFAYCQ